MAKDDILGTLGAVLSWIATTASFLWSIGALQIVFSFLAGAFTTYVVQRRLQVESEKRKIKRENAISMRDKIYGPIFEELSEFLESVRSVQDLSWEMPESLKGVMGHYLYFTIKQELRNEISEILDRFEKYVSIRRATEVMLRDLIKTAIIKDYQVDIGSVAAENMPHISPRLGKIHVAVSSLITLILQDMKPRDFITKATKKWGEDLILEVSIGGKTEGSLSGFESVYNDVLREAEKNSLYIEEKKQRKRLINELEAILGQVRVFVDLE
jgi:hypothetical protein